MLLLADKEIVRKNGEQKIDRKKRQKKMADK